MSMVFAKKHVEIEKLRPNIQAAISHAKQKDIPPCTDWPRGNGSTECPFDKFLIYHEGPEPENPLDNWLLDSNLPMVNSKPIRPRSILAIWA